MKLVEGRDRGSRWARIIPHAESLLVKKDFFLNKKCLLKPSVLKAPFGSILLVKIHLRDGSCKD